MSFQRFTVWDASPSLESPPNTLQVMLYTHITCPSTKLGPTSCIMKTSKSGGLSQPSACSEQFSVFAPCSQDQREAAPVPGDALPRGFQLWGPANGDRGGSARVGVHRPTQMLSGNSSCTAKQGANAH